MCRMGQRRVTKRGDYRIIHLGQGLHHPLRARIASEISAHDAKIVRREMTGHKRTETQMVGFVVYCYMA
jgi:hypothetical protein